MKSLVDQFLSNPTHTAMHDLVDKVSTNPVSDDDIAYFATAMARSGNTFSPSGRHTTADLASTGAPTSLSTLLGPLYLRSMGCSVPKLGVPGRPAGGVDALAQLPGYNVTLTANQIIACLEQCGYSHSLANRDIAPLDARLFRFRQCIDKQDLPELVIASILAKKIAVGIQNAGVDVRVAPHGNFGRSWETGRANAQRFCRVANTVGINAVCFLTDARFPYQPFLGRGEALLALKEVFAGTRHSSLRMHAAHCFVMANAIANQSHGDPKHWPLVIEKHFYANLEAQGSSKDAFQELVHQIQRGHRFHYLARNTGFVNVRLNRLRTLIQKFQSAGRMSPSRFPDRIGLVLNRSSSDFVRRGDLLATIRVAEPQWRSVKNRLKTIFVINQESDTRFEMERITNA